jgi:hypothetical protein
MIDLAGESHRFLQIIYSANFTVPMVIQITNEHPVVPPFALSDATEAMKKAQRQLPTQRRPR